MRNGAVTSADAASWLFHSGNGGVTWHIVNEQYDDEKT